MTDFLQGKRIEYKKEDEYVAFVKNKADEKYDMYRLIFEGGMSKAEVSKLTLYELDEAIAALNLHNRKINEAIKGSKQ